LRNREQSHGLPRAFWDFKTFPLITAFNKILADFEGVLKKCWGNLSRLHSPFFNNPQPKQTNTVNFSSISNVDFSLEKEICSPCISLTQCVSRTVYLKEMKKHCQNLQKRSQEGAIEFMRWHTMVDKNSWKMNKNVKSPLQKAQDNYIKTLMIWKEIEHEATLEKLVPIFFTGTVVGELHPFSQGCEISKSDWEIGNIKKGYKELQAVHTAIRWQCNRSLGYSPTYIRAVEYHKTFMPHTHIVYFVKPDDVASFCEIVQNKVDLNENVGRTEITPIKGYDPENGKSPVSYLLKYLKKTAKALTEGGNTADLETFLGWKKLLGTTQIYSNSKIAIPKWVIKKLTYEFKNFEELGYRSMIEAIVDNVEVTAEVIAADGKTSIRAVNTAIEPTHSIYRKTQNIEKEELNCYETEEEFVTDKIIKRSVKTLDFVVKKGDKVIFDKSWFELVEDWELYRFRSELKIVQFSKLGGIENGYCFPCFSIPFYSSENNENYQGKTYEYHFVDSS